MIVKDLVVQEKRYFFDDMIVEITSFCNLNCPICFNDSSVFNEEIMELEDFKTIVRKIKNMRVNVQLSGGEPLTHPHITEIIDILIENDIKFHINTNGMLMTPQIMDRFINYPNVSIQLSMDGANAETDDKLRCKGHYDRLICLMKAFNEAGFKGGTIKMVINRLNCDQIEAFFQLAMQYNFIPAFAFMYKIGRAQMNWDELYIAESQQYEIRNKIRGLINKNIDYFLQFDSKQLVHNLRTKNISYANECQFNKENYKFAPVIKPDGSVQPCQGLYTKEFCIGNIFSQSVDEIVSSGNYLVTDLLERIRKRRDNLDKVVCKSCFLNSTCGKGCVAESYNKGDFYGTPMNCEMRKRDALRYGLMGRIR